MIDYAVYISLAGAILFPLLSSSRTHLIRLSALVLSSASLVMSIAGTLRYTGGGQFLFITDVEWVPMLGIRYALAVDGISCAMAILTGLASVAGVLFSWNITHRLNTFFSLYFLLLAGVFGVFLSADLFLLFIFYEIAIIPKYFLIAIWGTPATREYGAMKLALYSFVGSGLVLIGLLASWALGDHTFSLVNLSQAAFTSEAQNWLFPLTFIGFAILAGLWPFHTWAPTGHAAAPTAVSMLLAGVVMKLGAYGAFRVSMTLFPQGLASWQVFFAGLAVIGIIYGAAVALTQTDFKYVIGYSSISHMGFVLLGLAVGNEFAVTGAILQMFSHGIIAGLLFAVVGRMVYERTHTRDLSSLSSLGLGRKLPFAGVIFVLASCASMGLPGFSGFIAELTILIGAWESFPKITLLSGAGILIVIVFTMRALTVGFYSGVSTDQGHIYEPISLPEKAGAILLLGTSVVVGLYPSLLIDLILPALTHGISQNALPGAG